jgi:hypothetical protein
MGNIIIKGQRGALLYPCIFLSCFSCFSCLSMGRLGYSLDLVILTVHTSNALIRSISACNKSNISILLGRLHWFL